MYFDVAKEHALYRYATGTPARWHTQSQARGRQTGTHTHHSTKPSAVWQRKSGERAAAAVVNVVAVVAMVLSVVVVVIVVMVTVVVVGVVVVLVVVIVIVDVVVAGCGAVVGVWLGSVTVVQSQTRSRKLGVSQFKGKAMMHVSASSCHARAHVRPAPIVFAQGRCHARIFVSLYNTGLAEKIQRIRDHGGQGTKEEGRGGEGRLGVPETETCRTLCRRPRMFDARLP